eukprot:1156199-Pelagomonas_calceolata.AAC.1
MSQVHPTAKVVIQTAWLSAPGPLVTCETLLIRKAVAPSAPALHLQDVEAVIGDYDGDVGSRDREYQAALKEYNLILLQLEEYGKGHAEMLQERLEYEEQQRKLAQEKLQIAVGCALLPGNFVWGELDSDKSDACCAQKLKQAFWFCCGCVQTALRQVRMTRAAKTIQSFWKGIKAKRALEAKKKKKAEAKAKKKP